MVISKSVRGSLLFGSGILIAGLVILTFIAEISSADRSGSLLNLLRSEVEIQQNMAEFERVQEAKLQVAFEAQRVRDYPTIGVIIIGPSEDLAIAVKLFRQRYPDDQVFSFTKSGTNLPFYFTFVHGPAACAVPK